jgi:hypothetical protein
MFLHKDYSLTRYNPGDGFEQFFDRSVGRVSVVSYSDREIEPRPKLFIICPYVRHVCWVELAIFCMPYLWSFAASCKPSPNILEKLKSSQLSSDIVIQYCSQRYTLGESSNYPWVA